MKKLTAIFIAVLLVIGCFSVMAASAADTATITVDGKTYTVDVGKTLTYTVNLKTVHKVTNGEFYLGYPQSVLTIANDDAFDFPVVGKNSVTYNYTENIQDEFRFNFSNQANPIDFTNDGVLVTINFTVTAAGSGSIGFINETSSAPGELTRESILSWVDTDYSINDELPNATFTYSLSGYNPETPTSEETESTDPTGDTQATDPTSSSQETQPSTEPPATTIKVKAAKTSIYVNATTKVTATVDNPVGTTTFKSSNTSVATVKASGNTATITGKKAGSVTITATNNSKSASVKITIVKRANPMTVKAKACSAKAKKNTTIKKAKAFTIKNAKGTVTFKKSSGDKKISINKKTGNITVKKGLKKGKTFKLKVKVTAAGNTAYKAGSKTVTVKIKIK